MTFCSPSCQRLKGPKSQPTPLDSSRKSLGGMAQNCKSSRHPSYFGSLLEFQSVDTGVQTYCLLVSENYCRNPDGESVPWCYSIDPRVRWEHCEIPMCNGKCIIFCPFTVLELYPFLWTCAERSLALSDDKSDCKETVSGLEYSGTRNTTRLGYTCQRWSSTIPHNHYHTDQPGESRECSTFCFQRNPALGKF